MAGEVWSAEQGKMEKSRPAMVLADADVAVHDEIQIPRREPLVVQRQHRVDFVEDGLVVIASSLALGGRVDFHS
jgi:hypothetical protein